MVSKYIAKRKSSDLLKKIVEIMDDVRILQESRGRMLYGENSIELLIKSLQQYQTRTQMATAANPLSTSTIYSFLKKIESGF